MGGECAARLAFHSVVTPDSMAPETEWTVSIGLLNGQLRGHLSLAPAACTGMARLVQPQSQPKNRLCHNVDLRIKERLAGPVYITCIMSLAGIPQHLEQDVGTSYNITRYYAVCSDNGTFEHPAVELSNLYAGHDS